MNKITFGLLALCFSFLNILTAQVTVGNGNIATSNVAYPLNFYYGYSYGQSIYLASEINTSGDITAISFEMANENPITNSDDLVDVWIGHTSKSTFETISDWIDVSTLTQVMSEGSITKSGTTITFTFETPFTYNGEDNLVVAIDLNELGYDAGSNVIYGTNVGVSRTLANQHDSNNPDPTDPPFGTRSDYRGNITFYGITQSCAAPSDLAASDITMSSAAISWEENGTAEEWLVAYGEAGFTIGDVTPFTATQQAVTLEELVSGTTYEFYVQANCGDDDTSVWVGPYEFTTVCDVVEGEFSENFDDLANGGQSNPIIPNCWSVIATGNAFGTVTSMNSASSPYGFKMYQGNTSETLLFISPEIDVLNEGYQVTFKAKGYGMAINLGTITDPNDAATFTSISTVNTTSSFDSYTVEIPMETTDSYFAFQYAGPDYTSLDLDDIVFETIPTCVEPTEAIVASEIEIYTALLSWDASQSEASSWNLEWSSQDFEPGASLSEHSQSIANASELELSDLEPNTTYYVYYQADCGAGDTSTWAGPFTFTTPCMVTTLPYLNDFSEYPGDCWYESNNRTIAEGPLKGSSAWLSGDYLNNDESGLHAAKINLWNANDQDWLVSNVYSIPEDQAYGVAYEVGITAYDDVIASNMGSDDEVQFLISADLGLTWTSLEVYNSNNTPSHEGEERLYDLSAYGGQDVIFAFWASEGTVDDEEDYEFFITNFELDTYQVLGVVSLKNESFSYFPNPVNDKLTITATHPIQTVVVYSVLGEQLIVNTPNSVQYSIPMTKLPKGTYFVKVITIEGTTKEIKVLKR